MDPRPTEVLLGSSMRTSSSAPLLADTPATSGYFSAAPLTPSPVAPSSRAARASSLQQHSEWASHAAQPLPAANTPGALRHLLQCDGIPPRTPTARSDVASYYSASTGCGRRSSIVTVQRVVVRRLSAAGGTGLTLDDSNAVVEVSRGGPAHLAGVSPGMVVVGVDGVSVLHGDDPTPLMRGAQFALTMTCPDDPDEGLTSSTATPPGRRALLPHPTSRDSLLQPPTPVARSPAPALHGSREGLKPDDHASGDDDDAFEEETCWSQWQGHFSRMWTGVVWLVLVVAVIGLSSKPVVAHAMYDAEVTPVVKGLWMTCISSVCFVLLGAYEVIRDKGFVVQQLRHLPRRQSASLTLPWILGIQEPDTMSETTVPWFGVLMLLLTSILHGLFSTFFLLSLKYTTLEQCVVLMNAHPVLVLCSRLRSSTTLERVGAVVVILGVVGLCFSTPPEEDASNPLLGNLLAFAVSVFMWFYLSLSQRLQKELPGGVLMAFINLGSLAVQFIFLLTFDSTPVSRLFANFAEYLLPNLLGGLLGGALAYGGIMLGSRYLTPMVVSVHITLEPLFAVGLDVICFGVVPVWGIWASLVVMIGGTVAATLGGKDPRRFTYVFDDNDVLEAMGGVGPGPAGASDIEMMQAEVRESDFSGEWRAPKTNSSSEDPLLGDANECSSG